MEHSSTIERLIFTFAEVGLTIERLPLPELNPEHAAFGLVSARAGAAMAWAIASRSSN
ncbi:hypothetical protein KIH79_02515 [Bifidobacterium sp. 82T10]|uniref:Uncharacterized protein n=1 Tax=Bifidobacterium miconis TaxID=2834435 RepID=A0ABS6WDA9_9BIFI|nr:hypothetical protein [Bifidobacterium miconis]MBW3091842.1 hypothetical protein [Bifidobacterium miconis]